MFHSGDLLLFNKVNCNFIRLKMSTSNSRYALIQAVTVSNFILKFSDSVDFADNDLEVLLNENKNFIFPEHLGFWMIELSVWIY